MLDIEWRKGKWYVSDLLQTSLLKARPGALRQAELTVVALKNEGVLIMKWVHFLQGKFHIHSILRTKTVGRGEWNPWG